MNADSINSATFPQTTQVEEWIVNERSKGLVDIKFLARPSRESTLETFSAEVNKLLQASTISHSDLF